MIWCCPSRGRWPWVLRLSEAWADTGATAALYLRLDDDDPDVGEDALHPLWIVRRGPRIKPSAAMNEMFEAFPDEDCYGFIGDDGVPRTKSFDKVLKEGANSWNVAYPDDLWKRRCSHPVVGGDLVRAVGWYGCPAVVHLYIDTAWADIGQDLGCLVYCPDAQIEHLHPCTKRVPRLASYAKPSALRDRRAYRQWLQSEQRRLFLTRLRIERLMSAGSAEAG